MSGLCIALAELGWVPLQFPGALSATVRLSCTPFPFLLIPCLSLQCFVPLVCTNSLLPPLLSCLHLTSLSCQILNCPALSCPVLPCPVLSCPDLSCPVLTCPLPLLFARLPSPSLAVAIHPHRLLPIQNTPALPCPWLPCDLNQSALSCICTRSSSASAGARGKLGHGKHRRPVLQST